MDKISVVSSALNLDDMADEIQSSKIMHSLTTS